MFDEDLHLIIISILKMIFRKDSVFKFLRVVERFRKAQLSWRSCLDNTPNPKKNTALNFKGFFFLRGRMYEA